MARPSSLPGVSGGGVALKPAFAGEGDREVQPSKKPLKHIAKGRPISGNLSRVPAIVRARDGDPVLAISDDGLCQMINNLSSGPVIREE